LLALLMLKQPILNEQGALMTTQAVPVFQLMVVQTTQQHS